VGPEPARIEVRADRKDLVYSYLDLGGEGVVPLATTTSFTNDFTFEQHPQVAGDGLLFLNIAAGLDFATFQRTLHAAGVLIAANDQSQSHFHIDPSLNDGQFVFRWRDARQPIA
jgi:hypothetical protein